MVPRPKSKAFVLFADAVLGARISAILAEENAAVKAIVLRENIDPALRESILAPWSQAVPEILSWKPGLPDGGLAEELEGMTFDIGLLAWWPHIISDRLIATATVTFLNTHPSFLPHGRGKDPNFWAFVDGTPFGVTIHHVVRSVDCGPIAFQRAIPIEPSDTGETLYQKATSEMENLFREVGGRIVAGDIPSLAQPEGGPPHKRRELEAASQIHLERTYRGDELLDLLRARTFPPHPASWFEKEGKRYDVRISITERSD